MRGGIDLVAAARVGRASPGADRADCPLADEIEQEPGTRRRGGIDDVTRLEVGERL